MKKAFLFITLVSSFWLNAENTETVFTSKQEQLEDIDQSIEMLKKWQKKFINKQHSYESRRRRMLFKTKTPKDAQRADYFAEEARQNAQEIQTQIDRLEEQKASLEQAPL